MCCWWCFNVISSVLRNLARRFFTQLTDVSYMMCCLRCRSTNIKTTTNICDEKWTIREDFYKDIDRHNAEILLKSKQNGTFIIRPSSNSLIATLSLVQDNKMFHLNIRRRDDNLIALGLEKPNEKCFTNVDSLINYYISNYLVLYSNGSETLTLLLPYRDHPKD